MATLKKYQKLIIRMLSPQNIKVKGLSESEEELLRKGLDWYGHFLSMIKITSAKLPAPAASFVDKEKLRPTIYIDDEKFDKFPFHEQIAIMKHEVLHILNEHFARRGEKYKNSELWNVATDLAINQLIPFIPKEGLHLDQINKELGLDLKENMPAEYYYEELEKEYKKCQKQQNQQQNNNDNNNNNQNQQNQQENQNQNQAQQNKNNNNSSNSSNISNEQKEDKNNEQNNGNENSKEKNNKQDNDSDNNNNNDNDNDLNNEKQYGNGQCKKCKVLKRLVEGQARIIDSHELWDNLSETEKRIIKENIENLIKEATNKARGTCPAEIEEILKLLREKNKINWKKYLKKLLSNKKVGKTKTIKRRDRRFPKRLDLKGNKKDIKGEILVVLDVSGSMSNQEIQKSLNEIFYIIKNMKYKVHLIEVDTEPKIYPDFEKDIKKLEFKRKGIGGTYLFPGIEKADELKLSYDLILIITDGYIENLTEWKYIPKKPILFLLTEKNNHVESEYGKLKNVKILNLDINQNKGF